MTAGIAVTVRALLVAGANFRRRAGRAWTKEPIAVRVVLSPATPDEIGLSQFREIEGDPLLVVTFAGGESRTAPLKQAIVEADTKIAELRSALGDAIEADDVEAEWTGRSPLEVERSNDSKSRPVGERLIELESLRAELVQRLNRETKR